MYIFAYIYCVYWHGSHHTEETVGLAKKQFPRSSIAGGKFESKHTHVLPCICICMVCPTHLTNTSGTLLDSVNCLGCPVLVPNLFCHCIVTSRIPHTPHIIGFVKLAVQPKHPPLGSLPLPFAVMEMAEVGSLEVPGPCPTPAASPSSFFTFFLGSGQPTAAVKCCRHDHRGGSPTAGLSRLGCTSGGVG